MVGESKVDSPYLSIVELVNDGSKPIPSASFEGPIEISTDSNARILRARVSSSNPPDITAPITLEQTTAKIGPLLLNPGDTIRMVILTSGSEPRFLAKSRIAGISSINVEYTTTKPEKWKAISLQIPIGMISLVFYIVFAVAIVRPTVFALSRPLAAAVTIICLTNATTSLRSAFTTLDLQVDGYTRWFIFAFSATLGTYLAYRLLKRVRLQR